MLEKIEALIIEDIFNNPYKCKCGKNLDASNLEYGDIEGIFKCSCGENYVLGALEDVNEIVMYSYDYKNGFIINKETYFKVLDRENKRYSYSKENSRVESLYFFVNEGGLQNFRYVYRDEMGKKREVPKDFFNRYSINDFRDTAKWFKDLSIKNNIKPNYGEIIEPFCIKRNMRSYLEFFSLMFNSNIVELMVKDGLDYLIKIDPVYNVK